MGRHRNFDDDQVIVVERDESSSFGTFLLGLALGAGAALLFAPASGEETRARLQDEARRAGRRVKDMTDDITEELSDRVERTRSAIDEGVDRAKDAVTSRARAVSDAASVGREAAAQARSELERAVADSKRAYAESRRAQREARVETRAAVRADRAVGLNGDDDMDGGTPGEG